MAFAPGKKFRPNKLRKWPRARGSFFIIDRDNGVTPPPFAGYILQENGAVVLGEDTAKLIIE